MADPFAQLLGGFGPKAKGNIDLNNRPVRDNGDGTISTVRSMSFNEDGKEILVPTIADDGRELSDDEAIDLYHQTGKNLGVFNTPEEATTYAEQLHNQQAEQYGGQQPGADPYAQLLGGFAPPAAQPAAAPGQQGLFGGMGAGVLSSVGNYMPNMPSAGDAAAAAGLDEIEPGARNFLAGFNQKMAQTLALPGATVDAALQQIGIDLFSGRPPDETGLNMFRKAFEGAGINTTPEEGSTMGKIGKASGDAAIFTAALLAAAPAIVASKGGGVAGDAARMISDFAAKNPGLFAVGEQFSVPGQVVGGEQGEKLGGAVAPYLGASKEAGRTVGGLAGGVLGGMATGMLTPNVLARRPKTDAFDEAINPNGNPADVPRFAQEQIAGELTRVDDDIRRAIGLVQSDNPAPEASNQFRKALEDARLRAKAAESRYYDKIDDSIELDPTPLGETIKEIRDNTLIGGNPSAWPGKALDSLMSEIATGKPMTVKRLLGWRTAINQRIAKLNAKPGNAGKVSALGDVETRILDTIGSQLPDDVAVQQAHNFSREVNDRFTRGPISEVLAVKSNRGPAVDPGQTMEKLLGKYGASTQVKDVGIGVPGDMATLSPDVINTFENGVRAEFKQDLALASSPEKAEAAANAFIVKNRATLDDLANGGADLEQSLGDLRSALTKRKEIKSSDLAGIAKFSAPKAIDSLFSAKNPGAAAEALVGRMKGNKDALEGLQTGVLERIIKQAMTPATRYSPGGTLSAAKLRNLLDPRLNADANEVYQKVLSPTQLRDLRQLSSDAFEAERTAFGRGIKAYTIAGQILGGMIGRTAHRVTGVGGTLQSQQLAAKLGGNFVTENFKRFPVEELLASAIYDPRIARIINSRVPRSPKELRALANQVRGITSGFREGQRQRDNTPLRVDVTRPANWDQVQ